MAHTTTIETKNPWQAGPNFRVLCSCGKTINVASVRMAFAEAEAERHVSEATQAEEVEAMLESLFATEEDQEDDPRSDSFNLFADPDYQMDSRWERDRGLS